VYAHLLQVGSARSSQCSAMRAPNCWHHRLDISACCPSQGLATMLHQASSLSLWSTDHAVRLSPATRSILIVSDDAELLSAHWWSVLQAWKQSGLPAKRLQGKENTDAKLQRFLHFIFCLIQYACIKNA